MAEGINKGGNMPSITVSDFIAIVKAQLDEKNYRPIFGLGKGGIGKTESLYELSQELGIGYVDIRLLLYSETDLKGIPYPNEEHTKTIWLQNNILPTVEKNGDRGILVFDEITSCTRSVRTAAYQLLNERKLGEYILPDNWLVICIGNGEDDGGDYNGMEGNFLNRCSVFNILPNLDAWKDWAFKHNINPLVSSYVSFKPADLHSYKPDNETEMLFASPRSWVAVSNILNKQQFRKDDRILNARITANVGQAVGQRFIAFCKYKDQTVDPRVIIEKGEIPKMDNQEIIYITIQSVVKIVGERIMKDDQDYQGTIQPITYVYLGNALRWIMSLRVEYAVMGIKDLISYGNTTLRKMLLSNELNKVCPEFRKFAHDNTGIF